MKKYKLWKTVDCVIGGLYWKDGTGLVDSLLLGLYDEAGRLNYVGRTRVAEDAAQMTEFLKPLMGGNGFTGRAPGGKSRWSGKERKPVPLSRAGLSTGSVCSSSSCRASGSRRGYPFEVWPTRLPTCLARLHRIGRRLAGLATATSWTPRRTVSLSSRYLRAGSHPSGPGWRLAAEREPWLAIDPKPLAGERAFSLAPIIRSFEFGHSQSQVLYRLDRLSAELAIDRERARGWTVAQTVAWSFGSAHGRRHFETARWLMAAAPKA